MMKSFNASLLCSVACLLGVVATTSEASAQGIETVIVTAQKRAADIQDVPISIDVKSGEDLEAFQITDFKSLHNYVPNLLIQTTPGNDAIYLRGFGTQAVNYAFDQSVSLYVDGVYGGRNRQFMAPFFDVERIEVMRGPQGALLGKNTAAGALSVVTASPTDTFQGRASVSYNFFREGVEASGFVSGPLTDDVSARLAVQYKNHDGYIRNFFYDRYDPQVENFMTRGSVKFEPTENFELIVKLGYGDFTTTGSSMVHINAATGVLSETKNAGPALGGFPEMDQANAWNGSATANIGVGDHTVTLISGYSQYKARQDLGGGARANENWISRFAEGFEQFSQEVRLLSPTDQTVEYIVGAYYDYSTFSQFNLSGYRNFLGNPGFTGQYRHNFYQTAETWSAFALATWHITDRLRLSGSARFTNNSKDGTFRQTVDFGISLGAPQNLAASVSEDNFDPSVNLQYDVTDDIMLYASYGKGSKSGGFIASRTASPTNFTLRGETSTNYEIGAKTTWFDDQVLFNISLYRMPFEDLQVAFFNGAIFATVIGNAGAATSQGFEAQLSWLAAEGLQFDGSVAYLEAVYDDYPGAPCLAPPLQPPTCTQATNNQAGRTLQGASKWTGNLRAKYETAVSEDLMLGLTGVMSFRSKFTTTGDQHPIYGTQQGYAKFDLRIDLAEKDEKWGIAMIGKNLTDERTYNFSYLSAQMAPAVPVGFLEETRTVAIEGRVRF